MKKEYRILAFIGIFYLIFIMLFLAKFDFNASGAMFFSKDHIDELNDELAEGIVVLEDGDGYDGQYYYMQALDLGCDKVHLDGFRCQRILYPLLVNIFSFGKIESFPLVMLLINLVVVILGSYLFMLILKKHKADLNLAFLWAINVGLLICVVRDLVSPLMFFFILGGLYFYEEKNKYLSVFFFSLSLLVKESALLILVPLLIYFLLKKDLKKFFIYLIPLIVMFLWQLILFFKFGYIPFVESFFGVSRLPFSDYSVALNLLDLKALYFEFSSILVILFAVFQSMIISVEIVKNKIRSSPYLAILIFQLIYILFFGSFRNIYAMGRYAIAMFLFSILYYAESKKRYNRILAFLMVLMSILFIIEVLFFFGPLYAVI